MSDHPTLPLRVGVIGAGHISDAYLRIAPIFRSFEITAIADLQPERAEARADAYGISASTVPGLIDDGTIDAVLNLTVPAAHAAVSRAALEAGKHVYSEKPFATQREDARELLVLAEARNLRVGCAPDTFLGNGAQTARAALDSGLIGPPIAATAFMMSSGPERWHPDPAFFYAPGAGPLFDMGPYYLTMLVNLFGPVRSVSASATIGRSRRPILSEPHRGELIEVGTPTHVSALLSFRSGCVATVITSMDVPASELPRCEIYGSDATLSVPDPNSFGGTVRLKHAGDEDWTTLDESGGYSENSRGLGLAEMAAAIATGQPHRASGDLAFHVLDVMQTILEAASAERTLMVASSVDRPRALDAGDRF